jgi:hypothetical protein
MKWDRVGNKYQWRLINRCWSIGVTVCTKSKEHDERLKESAVGLKSSLPFISRLNANIVEAPADIQLGEVLCATELCHKLGNEWERVLVLHCDHIEGPIVLNKIERAILLLDEEHQRSHGGFG